MRGDGHERVANFMRETIGHRFDQPQVGRLELELVQLLGLRAVLDNHQGRIGQR